MNAEANEVKTATAQLVEDPAKGLTWDARETLRLTFEQAEAHVAKMNAEKYGGFDNWRLPTYHELTGLVDVTRHSPAIDTEKFPNCESDWYWTGTPAAASPAGYAWVVSFGSGDALWGRRDSRAFVRAVRPSQ